MHAFWWWFWTIALPVIATGVITFVLMPLVSATLDLLAAGVRQRLPLRPASVLTARSRKEASR